MTVRPPWLIAAALWLLAALALAGLQAPHPNPLMPHAARGVADLLRYPVESHGALRLQVVPADLYAVTMDAGDSVAGQRGWAVGDSGTILTTADAGRRWTAQASGVQTTLRSIQMNPDGKQGWAVGDDGTILRTDDGGGRWTLQAGGNGITLFSVSLSADGRSGWAVGSDGTILRTDDAGHRWTPQPSGTQAWLVSVRMSADGQQGWIVGGDGTILRSNDGGARWHRQSSGVDDCAQPGADAARHPCHYLWSIDMNADGRRGWAVGDGGTILHTEDAGGRWVRQASGGDILWSVRMSADGQHGWAVGDGGRLLLTRDGGAHWAAQRRAVYSALHSVDVSADGLHAWAAGDGGSLLRSDDGAGRWSAQASGEQSTLRAVALDADGRRGWVVGDGGTILRTDDGGAGWMAQASGVHAMLMSVRVSAASAGALRGWAVGEGGSILRTDNGGDRWTAQPSGVTAGLHSIDMDARGSDGWAVGDDGTILRSDDGGSRWTRQASGVSGYGLWSVHASPGGRHAWVVGDGGVILRTDNGGERWAPQASGATAALRSVHLGADDRRGWAVGEAGTILRTDDGGAHWAPQPSGVRGWLWSVRASADGLDGRAVGEGGVVLVTRDGGRHWAEAEDAKAGSTRYGAWFSADGAKGWAVGTAPALLHSIDGGSVWEARGWPLHYVRYPAPWFWIALALAVAMLWRAFRSVPATDSLGAEAIAASDAPAADFRHDRLQFGPLARGISRFLRNKETQPPFTIAIAGDWGSGKSSLMRLVCSDLRRYGGRPVWFNAWHHHKDEQLLAALLGAITSEGLPPTLSLDGLLFRLNLLWLRSKHHFLLAFVVLALLAATASFLMSHDVVTWIKLWRSIEPLMHRGSGAANADLSHLTGSELGKLIAQALTAVSAVVAVRKALGSFGVDPAALLTSTVKRFGVRDSRAQAGFRARFAAEFAEVTRALPYRTVIVIDDIDRCRPEAMLDVMEAVNFLVSAGECLVIFGMATTRVQAALALSFQTIALEVVEIGARLPANADPAAKAEVERKFRHRYAREYLEKLINLEIAVPVRADIEPHVLLERAAPNRREALADRLRRVLAFWPLLLGMAAIAAGSLFGWSFSIEPRGAVLAPAAQTVTASAPAPLAFAPSAPDAAPAAPASAAPTQAAPRYLPVVQPGDENETSLLALGVPALALLLVGAALTALRLRGNLREVSDSDAFRDAMRAWLPVVQAVRKTPRGLKRFGNRIRYLAMLQQAERLDDSQLDELRRRGSAFRARWFPPRAEADIDAVPRASAAAGIEEHRIVALGALHEALGDEWRGFVTDGRASAVDARERAAIDRAIQRYQDATGKAWPPTDAELDAFAITLTGVRVSGDATTIPSQDRAAPG